MHDRDWNQWENRIGQDAHSATNRTWANFNAHYSQPHHVPQMQLAPMSLGHKLVLAGAAGVALGGIAGTIVRAYRMHRQAKAMAAGRRRHNNQYTKGRM
jgi:hypothetical protein